LHSHSCLDAVLIIHLLKMQTKNWAALPSARDAVVGPHAIRSQRETSFAQAVAELRRYFGDGAGDYYLGSPDHNLMIQEGIERASRHSEQKHAGARFPQATAHGPPPKQLHGKSESAEHSRKGSIVQEQFRFRFSVFSLSVYLALNTEN
jgi:hypothetical protein